MIVIDSNAGHGSISKRTVCVISPQRDAYSQTFVRAHREYLPAKITNLYTSDYENLLDDAGPLLRTEFSERLRRAILRRSFNISGEHFQRQALRKFLEQKKVEAVLAEFGPTATLVMEVCREMNIPLVAHFHGFDAYRHDTLKSYGARYVELFRIAAALIAVSQDMVAQLKTLGAPPEKVHYNSCGVDPTQFQGADPIHSPATFVSVGRFVNKKAPHLTLLAFQRTLKNVPDARLVMIGDGPLWEACRQMTRSLDLAQFVELPGRRSQSEVATTMRNARAFVQHSITTQDGDMEGTPVAVLEASASGLPVIATRHAGIKEAVRHEKSGLLVEEGDIQGMADQMTRLAQDPGLASSLGKAGRDWVSSNYSMERSINRLWDIIESTMDRSA